jgi:hypothetical protein
MVFSLDTHCFKSNSQSVSLITLMNYWEFLKMVPGDWTTARISSRPRTLDLMFIVLTMLFWPPPKPPMYEAAAGFGTSF